MLFVYSLFEESLVGYPYIYRGLIVVGLVEEPFAEFCLYCYLPYRVIVYSSGNSDFPSIRVSLLVFGGNIGIVIFVTHEDKKFLPVQAFAVEKREYVVTAFGSYRYSVLSYWIFLVRRVVRSQVPFYVADGRGIAEVAVIGIASYDPVVVVVVIGGSGSGKTRFFVKPNLMQLHSSYVLTDPKGTVLIECGKLLQRGGYKIKVLNTINFKKSMRYNPFVYIRSEKDVLKVVNTLIVNTKGEGEKSAEDFWVKAERLLYCALIGYIWYEAPAEEMNFTTLLELINASEAREDDEEYQSPVDLLFADLEERSPDHFAVKQYKKYKLAAGKTAKSILISCGARLAPFDIEELRELMSYDELELDTLGDRKTALFLIMSDTDDTFNFVIAILQSQLFNLLCDKADDEYNGKLPIHVRFLLDEFANIGQIPRFDKLIATIRSREMSASIILQSQSQLKAIYKDAAEIILDNADSTLFLGGRGKNAKDISDNLGRETIDSFNTSENRGTQVSHGLTYQKLGKELMTQDEIAVMDGGKCILQLRGVRPFLSDKYDITKHPNYKYLSDFDKRNAFDVERYMSTRPAIVKPDEAFDIYEIDLSDEDAAAEE